MGITGLIPFLEKASKRENISKFSGGTVAIDSYCWLHKGAFSCAEKIALGQPTDGHVKYCMKFVHMLLANRIKPILVFDGRHLPAKKETEVKRRENRETLRRRAAELMRMGQTSEGRNLLRRCIDITHELALQLIKKCQEENVDCIVAPYEADAQLAYLNISGIADVVITEDSDLTLFGCKKIFFKMDMNGNGLLVEQDRLHLAMKIPADHFNMEKFRYMCILSGCDYLDSLPGIGLSKACKFVLRCNDGDIYNSLSRLGSYLNMKSLVVTKEYRDAFMRAFVTFKHQLVYCPLKRKQVRLFPPPPEVTAEQLEFAGNEVSADVAWQLALGNLDPFTMKKHHDFDPDVPQTHKGKTNSWHQKPATAHSSIWSRNFNVNEANENSATDEITKWPNTAGHVMVLNTETIKRKTVTPKKRNFGELATELTTDDMLQIYGSNKLQKNEKTSGSRSTPPPCLDSSLSREEEITSPKSTRSNPFLKTPREGETSPSLVYKGKRRIKLKNFVGFRATVIDENVVTKSKYFNTDSVPDKIEETAESISTDCVRIVAPTRRKRSTENVSENSKENNVINVNAEIQLNEESSSSSGVFMSDPSSEQIVDFTLEQESPEFALLNDAQQKSHKDDNNLLTLDRLLNTKCDITSRDNDVLPVSSQDSINGLKFSFFKWANPKAAAPTKLKISPQRKKAIVSTKPKTINKKMTQKTVTSLESQHSLQMFGFQKKAVLKH